MQKTGEVTGTQSKMSPGRYGTYSVSTDYAELRELQKVPGLLLVRRNTGTCIYLHISSNGVPLDRCALLLTSVKRLEPFLETVLR